MHGEDAAHLEEDPGALAHETEHVVAKAVHQLREPPIPASGKDPPAKESSQSNDPDSREHRAQVLARRRVGQEQVRPNEDNGYRHLAPDIEEHGIPDNEPGE